MNSKRWRRSKALRRRVRAADGRSGETQSDPFILRALTVIGVVGTIAVGYLEYRSFLDTERSKRSLELIDEWEAKGYRDDLEIVSDRLSALEDAGRQRLEANGIEATGALVADFVTNRLADDVGGLSEELDRLFYFFNKLALCISEDVCAPGILIRFFGPTMRNTTDRFDAYIEFRRTRNAAFSRDLDWLLDEF